MRVRAPAAVGLLAVLLGGHAAQSPPVPTAYSPIVELRQYTLHPGKRDVLVDMFDAHFVEVQEGAGIKVIGRFRNMDEPKKVVSVRGFPST